MISQYLMLFHEDLTNWLKTIIANSGSLEAASDAYPVSVYYVYTSITLFG